MKQTNLSKKQKKNQDTLILKALIITIILLVLSVSLGTILRNFLNEYNKNSYYTNHFNTNCLQKVLVI